MRIVFVEAERVLGEALAARLSAEPDIEGVWVVSGPEPIGAVLDELSPHVVVLALDSTAFAGAAVLERVTSRNHPPRILALTRRADPHAVVQTLGSGVHGWLPLAEPIESLTVALRAVASGDYWLPTSMVSGVLRELARPERPTSRLRLADLSDRERQVLAYAAEGLNRTEIATRLGLSPNTVRSHMQRVLSKLAVHSTLEAVTLMLKEAWLPTPSDVPMRASRPTHATRKTQIAGVMRSDIRA